jgi:hypothetical protein
MSGVYKPLLLCREDFYALGRYNAEAFSDAKTSIKFAIYIIAIVSG